MAPDTETLPADDAGPAAMTPGPSLVLALEAGRPLAGSSRYSLAGIQEVRIGRGDARRARRDRAVLSIEIPDGALSSLHVRLRRRADGWCAEDAGSKNGTFVNGAPVSAAPLDDGDLIDAARSFLVFVDPGGRHDPGDLDVAVTGGVLDTLDPELAARFAVLDRIAGAASAVLLLGETGTGKEVVARAIHDRSRRPGAYMAVNCGALPATLIESELFGARRGAFSGAVEDRPGLVRAADRGTLFLDEVAELAAPAQATLLRVLQEHEVVPVGGHAPVKVDLRIVAATCQDVASLIALGRFRPDLHARLAGFTVTLPALRHRRADVGLLIGRLLARHGGEAPPGLQRAAARALLSYAWPGNVRELDQALAAAVAIGDGEIALAHLPAAIRQPVAPPQAGPVDRARLAELLRAHQGNISRVAEAIATSRTQVRRLLARFSLSPDEFRASA